MGERRNSENAPLVLVLFVLLVIIGASVLGY